MRIVYMGTPEFARPPLARLCDSRHEVLALVTGQDKKVGRGHRLMPTPCNAEARRSDVPILTPGSLKDEQLYRDLEAIRPDLFVVVAFRILPERLFALPRLGSINIHASLLPKYRGAAPIHWALINGEKETGLTSFFLRRQVDTGDIILQERYPIFDDDNYDSLSARLSEAAGTFLLKTLDMIEAGQTRPVPQDDRDATPAPKISAFDAMIDFGFPAENVRNFVRGLSTKPGAYTFFRGKKVKVYQCAVASHSGPSDTRPGTILTGNKQLLVQCNGSAVELQRVVPEGKQEMDGRSFVNGFRPREGELFGEVPQTHKG
jgi:methionyl-tRNA formyltransferase